MTRARRAAEKESTMDRTAAAAREMVRFVEWLREEYNPGTGRVEAEFWSPRYQYPMSALAWLYANEHPDNPYEGDASVLEMCLGMVRHQISEQFPDGGFDGGGGDPSFVEWPAYYMIRTVEILGDLMPPDDRAAVEKSVAAYLAGVLPRPFVHTSFNHEAWRSLDAVAAGQCFGRDDWLEAGLYLARQLTRVQRPAGYWDEGPHHGPSASYNYVMLGPLWMIQRRTGDTVVAAAVDRLREFMLRFIFPDGTTPGCLDGRQSTGFAMGAAGLAATPQGRRLNRLAAPAAESLGLRDPLGAHYSGSNWGAHSRVANVPDRLEFWPAEPGGGEDEEPLPQESDGFVDSVGAGDPFDGGAMRKCGWMAVVSGYASDVTKLSDSVYRLERASRIDIWHREFGLVAGGGSNGSGAKVPFANVHLVTGFKPGAPVDFGLVGEAWKGNRQGHYLPRAASSAVTADSARVELHFGHGSVALEVRPVSETACEVAFAVDSMMVEEAFIQLPLIVMDGGSVSVGGSAVEPAPDGADAVPVTGAVELTSPMAPGRVLVTPPEGLECRLRPPVEPLRSYRGLEAQERYRAVYRIALLSVRVPEPRSERGAFRIELG